MHPTIFSCSHMVDSLPINNDYTTTKNEDGPTLISGLCRTCYHNHCEERHRLLKEYWNGRIHEQQRAILNAKDRLWFNHDEQLAALTVQAENMVEAWIEQAERELREVWEEFLERWGE